MDGVVSYTLPPGVVGTSFTTTSGSCVLSSDKTTLDCDLGSLPPGGTATVTFTGTPTTVSGGVPVSGSFSLTGTNPNTNEQVTWPDNTSGGVTIVVRGGGFAGGTVLACWRGAHCCPPLGDLCRMATAAAHGRPLA